MGIYQDMFGLNKVINASGTMTRLGGSLMPPEVIEAMDQAAKDWVRLDELLEKSGQIIADIAGAPACFITSGCAAAMTLAVAACITGKDQEKMRKLPFTEEMRNELIWQRGHYPAWQSQFQAPGAKIVLVGGQSVLLDIPEPASEQALIALRSLGCTSEDVEEAITDKTCALAYTQAHGSVNKGLLSLKEYCEIAHKHGLPVIVDASSELPPASNLGWFYKQGADITCFSGGKAIYGPNDTGFLLGREELVEAAALQASPHFGIGRGFKVSKEQIVGLVVAVQRYAKLDFDARLKEEMGRANYLLNAFKDVPHIKTRIVFPDETDLPVPRVWVSLDEKALELSATDVIMKLMEGDPAIYLRGHYRALGIILIDVQVMRPGEEKIVAERLKEVLSVENK